MGRDNRKAERFGANLFVEFESSSDSSVGRGVVVDVSLSGFAVDTEADLSINSELECHIEIPVTLKARVVRAIIEGQVKRYGLKFVDQGLIDKFVFRKILKGKRQTRKV